MLKAIEIYTDMVKYLCILSDYGKRFRSMKDNSYVSLEFALIGGKVSET